MAVILGNPIMLGGGGGSQSDLKKISTLSEGDIIKIKENGVLTDYYLAQHDYQPSLNGSGRVLFARKEGYGYHVWNSSANSTYANSTIDTFLNGDFKTLFDADVREAMGETSIPNAVGYGNSSVTTLQKSVFLLSVTELGKSHSNASVEGEAVPIADMLDILNVGGEASAQWTRTPYNGGTGDVWWISSVGTLTKYAVATGAYGIRPCFTLPNTATVNPEPNVDGSYTLELENVNLTLDSLMAGDTVRVKEKGVFQDYYVAQQNYQPNLNGAGRTLFVRKNLWGLSAWNSADVNAYANSIIDTLLNGEIKALYDAAVREAMGETAFPYTPGGGTYSLSTIQRSIFMLSLAELGKATSDANVEGEAVPIASILQIAHLDGVATSQWTRSVGTVNSTYSHSLDVSGSIVDSNCTDLLGVRPCFTLPAFFSIEQNDLGTYDLVYESDYPMGYLELTIEGGTTQPTNPKDNTIWVNTDVDLGLTYLAPNAPSNPQVGDVWVNTTNKYNSNGTNASTNLIRVNDNPYLEINVLNISQWDGSAWVTREGSAIYANGAWTNMALWIFNNGTRNEDYPILYGLSSSASGVPSLSTNGIAYASDGPNNYFYVDISSSYAVLTTEKTADFSRFTKMSAKLMASVANTSFTVGYFPATNPLTQISYSGVRNYAFTQLGTNTVWAPYELVLDISDIAIEARPCLLAYKGSSSRVYTYYWCLTA